MTEGKTAINPEEIANNKTTKAVNFGGNKKSEKQKADGAGGDNSGGRIICTELYRQGLISRKDYMLDLQI